MHRRAASEGGNDHGRTVKRQMGICGGPISTVRLSARHVSPELTMVLLVVPQVYVPDAPEHSHACRRARM